MATCARDECQKPFTKRTPWQRYCTMQCRMAFHNQHRRDHYAASSALSVVGAAMNWYRAHGAFAESEALRAACERHIEDGA